MSTDAASKARVLPDNPFTVVLSGKRFRITPGDDGWLMVRCLDRRGVNTQGRSLDEACFMALDALCLAESCDNDPWPIEAQQGPTYIEDGAMQ